ncbi:MAG: alkaline phosphatase family protein [bacterium]
MIKFAILRNKLAGLALLFLLFGTCYWGCSRSKANVPHHKTIVVGFDGMDPQLLSRYMDQGLLPNLAKLAQMGDYKTLGTSNPPQSPVAWSNFITGMNPGGHGIFDFIHRDPTLMIPVSSTAKTEGSKRTITIGNWVIPLSGGKVELLRKGRAFWEVLEDHGIPTTVFKVPANFPPVKSKGKSVSGMGTPDLLGSYGTFSYYTDDPPPNRDDISGGIVYPVQPVNNEVEAKLVGPKNAFRKGEPDATIPFKVWCDPEYPTAKIVVQDHQILLKEKEWSNWTQVKFELIPGLQSVTGICRFYLKEVRPNFKLYVTPINIDPSNPALPISTPEDYAKELEDHCGFFYTQGMPEDTKALSWGVFDYDDFHGQGQFVLDERMRLFDYVLNNFEDGLLFFYFSSSDLNAHMFYNMIDPQHPSYDPEKAKKFGNVLASIYQNLDTVVGKVLARSDPNTTVIVMSDHGFAPFRRAVHLNTWLKDQGYIKLIDESKQAESEFFQNVDWSQTKAYGVGFNGLYFNMRGREASGIVTADEKEALIQEISQKLLALRDPKDGSVVVSRVYRAEDVYSGQYADKGPDLIVGYNRGYRASWETTIGNFPQKWIEDNLDPWSGDHCMAPELVPGIILSNKPIKAEHPKLFDLAPTILAEYGIAKEKQMVGKPIFN